ALAEGALWHSVAQVSVAVSGVAGPLGGSASKPVGTVCLGWATPSGVTSQTQHFEGERDAVRAAAVRHALQGLLRLIEA
ncbi:MAG: CinA family protein, partial [Serpentinimonas sp.]|nr:CinA family protein [Serpentinimonas sp.]